MPNDPSSKLFQNYLRHYQHGGAERWRVPYTKVKEFHLDRLPRWIGRLDHGAMIVEVGCATGYLLDLLHAEGFTNLTGVELSEQLVQVARSTLPSEITIIHSDVMDFLANTPDESFDAIFFYHVLEHIPREQTINLLAQFRRCLKPGGYLNIKVPNASYLLAGNHLFCDFTHVVHFNERSMPQVLEAAGFDPSLVEFISHRPLLFWSWKHPVRALMRLINRVRWLLHCVLHKGLCVLIEQRPIPEIFEAELEVLASKPG